MIDWVSAVLPFEHETPIFGGRKMWIDKEGECSAPVPLMDQVINRMGPALDEHIDEDEEEKHGSYTGKCAIQTSREHPSRFCHVPSRNAQGEVETIDVETWSHIYVSASPKFLQGHNLFAIDDPVRLCVLIAKQALALLGRTLDPWTEKRWLEGDIKFTRLDVTEMLDTGSEINAQAWMRAASETLTVRYRGSGDTRGDTLYVGKKSRLWALKIYPKFREINAKKKEHQLSTHLPLYEQLLDYARGTVRCEFVIRSMELKRHGLDTGKAWLTTSAREVWDRYMKKIELHGNMQLRDSQIDSLPNHLRGTYALWAEGRDLPNLLSRPTFFRHRKALKEHGIDIGQPPRQAHQNVVSLIRVIEARPKGIPQWAYGTPLLAA